MIIQDQKVNVVTHGELEKIDFEIKTDDSKMFHILSNLYSNPLGAVIRELSTNCADGHKINNCADKPFDIILPGSLDMGNFVKFRDYGPGMPHDVVTSIFTTFGQSTKVDSNLETGCLGLGSKSPLAITDSFTVTSINEGMSTVYSVTKNAEMKPQLAIFGQSETEEANGLMVTVPLTKQLMNNVEDEIVQQLKYFKTKPRIMRGSRSTDFNWRDDHKSFVSLTPEIFMKKESYDKKSKIIQGEVGYSFNSDTLMNLFTITDSEYDPDTGKQIKGVDFLSYDDMNISQATYDVLDQFFPNFELRIYMPMGTVTFAPSREELIYDNLTAKNILKEILKGIGKISQRYKEIYSNIDNPYHFKKLKNNIFGNLTLSKDIQDFISIIGFGFERHFSKEEYRLKDGSTPIQYFKNLSKLSYYDDIIDMRRLYVGYTAIEEKLLIRKQKDRWNRDANGKSTWTRHTDKLEDYISPDNYQNIKIVFVQPEVKFSKKHMKNYILSLKDADDDSIIKYLYIKVPGTDAELESFSTEIVEISGISMECIVPFSEVLKVSEQWIADGKVIDEKPISKKRTIKQTNILRLQRTSENWYDVSVTTDDIRNNLVGLYVETFNNKVVLSDKFLENELIKKLNNGFGGMQVFSKAIDILKIFGANINPKIKVYAGHVKNFNKTKLVKLEDYILQQIQAAHDRNGWHALNSETLTLKFQVKDDSKTSAIIKNLKFLDNKLNVEEEYDLHTKWRDVRSVFGKKWKSFRDRFYDQDNALLKAYDEYLSIDHANSVSSTSSTSDKVYDTLIFNKSDEDIKKIIEDTFDIKILVVDIDKIFEKAIDKYPSFEYFKNTYRYTTFSSARYYGQYNVQNMLTSIINDFDMINKQDYTEKTSPEIKTFHLRDIEPFSDPSINSDIQEEYDMVAE